MTESTKIPRPGAVPIVNPLLSASVTGITFDDFPNKPLLLPAAPPIVHTPSPLLTQQLVIGREQKSLVTVGPPLNNDDEGLDEINLNASNEDNVDENANNTTAAGDSILSQAASSFSALPTVASNVFATFSKRITGSSSRETTPSNEINSSQQQQVPPLAPQLDIQPSYIQQSSQKYTTAQQTSNLTSDGYFQNFADNAGIGDNSQPAEPPRFYTPSEITTLSTGLPPPPPPSSSTSGEQNNFRFAAKKKLYAPIPGLTDLSQQPASVIQPLTDSIKDTKAQQSSFKIEERRTGIFSNFTNFVPSGVLENISGLVQSATQSIKPDSNINSNYTIQFEGVTTTTNAPSNTNDNNPSLSTLSYFGSSEIPPPRVYNPVEFLEQKTIPLNFLNPLEFQNTNSASVNNDHQSQQPSPEVKSDNTASVDSFAGKEQLLGSVNVNYFDPSSQPTPLRPSRPPSRKSISLESDNSAVPLFNYPTTSHHNSEQSIQVENSVKSASLIAPPTNTQLVTTTAGGQSSFRLQKGTRLYKNPFAAEEIAVAPNVVPEQLTGPPRNPFPDLATSQQVLTLESKSLQSSPRGFSGTFPASPSESEKLYNLASYSEQPVTLDIKQTINDPITLITKANEADEAVKEDKSLESTTKFFQQGFEKEAKETIDKIDKNLVPPTIKQPSVTDTTVSNNPYRRNSNTATGSTKSAHFVLANFFTPSSEDSINCNFFTSFPAVTATDVDNSNVTLDCHQNIRTDNIASTEICENTQISNKIQSFFCEPSTAITNYTVPTGLNIASPSAAVNNESISNCETDQLELVNNIPPPIGYENSQDQSFITAPNVYLNNNNNNKNNNNDNNNTIKSCETQNEEKQNLTVEVLNSFNLELSTKPIFETFGHSINEAENKEPATVTGNANYNLIRSGFSGTENTPEETPSISDRVEPATSTCSDTKDNENITLGMATIPSTPTGSYKPAIKHWFYKRAMGAKEIWTPFSHYDSALLETSVLAGDETIVAVEGGRYDVNIKERKKISIYWDSEPIEVRRCSWFYKGVDSKYIPYEEDVADLLESEYKQARESANWQKTIILAMGEQVVFHGPTVIVHFQQQQNVDAWGGTSQNNSRPRVVKRDLVDFHIEEGESQKVDHLLFMVHGIGSACDLKLRSVEEVVDDFRSIARQLVKSHYKNSFDVGLVGRVEVLPISWHSDLHSSEMGIDEKLKSITLESIPKLRHFTNDTLLDILFYTSPTYCERIMRTVATTMNDLYTKYCKRNPDFSGGVSLAGHSLGSLILFDLLCNQKPPKESEEINVDNSDNALESSQETSAPKMGPRQISYTMGSAGTGQPFINYEQLIFQPKKFFALGSPIGMFVTVRGIDALGLHFRLPTCAGFYNIFHPYDPVAYRIEALINPDLSGIRPVLIPHHKGRKRMHLELKETMSRVSTDLKQKFFDKFKTTLETVDIFGLTSKSRKEAEELMEKEVEKVIEMQRQLDEHAEPTSDDNRTTRTRTDSMSTALSDDLVELDFPVGKLNDSKRVDYVLQEAPLEFFNEYIFALTSHVCYWDSEDTILFVMKEIYAGLGVTADGQVPQQTMTIERPNSRNSAASLP